MPEVLNTILYDNCRDQKGMEADKEGAFLKAIPVCISSTTTS